jgi:hypothetical protein
MVVVNKVLLRRLKASAVKLGYTCRKFGWGWAVFSPDDTTITPVCHDEEGAWRAAATNESLILGMADWIDQHV